MNSKWQPFQKKFATLAATAVFEIPFLPQKHPFSKLAGKNYPDSQNLQGGMNFATQISLLLNYYYCVCACVRACVRV